MSRWSPERLDALAARLQESPHIDRLSGGAVGVGATHLPGRQIRGLRIGTDDRIDIHVVMTWGSTVDDVEAGVLRALDDVAYFGSLYIDDISDPLAPTARIRTAVTC